MKLKKDIYIQSCGQTRFGELYDLGPKELVRIAADEALKTSGLKSYKDFDLVVASSMSVQTLQRLGHLSAWLTQVLGLSCPVISVDAACAGGGSAFGVALTYLEADDQIENVLVLGFEKLTDHTSEEVAEVMMQAADWEEEGMVGLTFPGINALVAERYFYEHPEVLRDALAQVAIKNHENGSRNKLAHMQKKLTKGEYLSSEWVCEPLRLYDCAPISDGAVAVVLGRRKSTNKVLGFVQEQDLISLHKRKELTRMMASVRGMEKLMKETGLSRDQISLAEVHDAFTILEPIAIADLGLDGKTLVNQSGGLKACGHPVAATGLRQISDLCLRLKLGQIGIAQNMGGIGGTVTLTLIKAV